MLCPGCGKALDNPSVGPAEHATNIQGEGTGNGTKNYPETNRGYDFGGFFEKPFQWTQLLINIGDSRCKSPPLIQDVREAGRPDGGATLGEDEIGRGEEGDENQEGETQ